MWNANLVKSTGIHNQLMIKISRLHHRNHSAASISEMLIKGCLELV